ncbi:protein ydcX [Salmonella enterica subsp. enterica serovar Madelia]|nr:protein ydcX [Salmonella enterica subsp. enterica serovar Madelia]
MTLFQKILIFLRRHGGDIIPDHLFLTHDKKRIRFLSAFLVGATWPISFPIALLFSLF